MPTQIHHLYHFNQTRVSEQQFCVAGNTFLSKSHFNISVSATRSMKKGIKWSIGVSAAIIAFSLRKGAAKVTAELFYVKDPYKFIFFLDTQVKFFVFVRVNFSSCKFVFSYEKISLRHCNRYIVTWAEQLFPKITFEKFSTPKNLPFSKKIN
jgi:hypothetical protein